MKQETQSKLDRILALKQTIDAAQKEIEELLSPKEVPVLPPDFSLSEEVGQLIVEYGEKGVSKRLLLERLQRKYPDYGLDNKQLSSSLAYLKNTKKEIESVDRGIYRVRQENAEKETTAQEQAQDTQSDVDRV